MVRVRDAASLHPDTVINAAMNPNAKAVITMVGKRGISRAPFATVCDRTTRVTGSPPRTLPLISDRTGDSGARDGYGLDVSLPAVSA